MKKALLVVDVQSYFLKGAPAGYSDRLAEQITKDTYDVVAFTVFKGEKDSNFERSLHWSSCQNEVDQRIPPVLIPYTTNENVFYKTGYSAFSGTRVQEFMESHDITNIDICGIDLEACVLTTAYAAFDLGYDTKVLFGLCHSKYSPPDVLKEIIKRNIQSKNG